MKKLILIALVAFVLASASTANAQLFRRACSGGSCAAYRSCYGGSCAFRSGYAYAATSGYWTSGQCYGGSRAIAAPAPCERVVETAPTPCEPATTAPIEASETFDRYYPAPCEPASTVEPCAPIETTTPAPCEACGEYEPIKKSSGTLVYRSCPTGACPLQAAAKTTATVAKKVATLLDRVNAFRAQYGLSALAYDSTLTGGAQYQAGFCAYRGALVHGSGAAEILAQNSQGIETALNQWLNSPAHRALLLNPSYRFGGVAVHKDGSGRVWCAMRFR